MGKFNKDSFKSLLQKRVVFKELVFKESSFSLNCDIDEDWDIVNNLVNLRGMKFTIMYINSKWDVTGNGEILVLGRTVRNLL